MILTVGCSKNQLIPNQSVYCNKPIKPILQPLKEKENICTKENITIIISNSIKFNKYTEDLDSWGKCYEDTLK